LLEVVYLINYMRFFRAVLAVSALFLLFFPSQNKASAASLTSAKDTITTSRPSASTPLSANAASGATQASVYDNSSRFLASDSAKLTRAGTDIDSAIIIASQSSALTTVYFGDTLGAAGQNGTDVLFVPITAMHTIQFIVPNGLPTNGDIVLTFPTLTSGDADNDASPSATTFQFNNLVSGTGGRDNIDVFDDASDISANVTITETEPSAGNPGILSINLDSGTIAGGSVVKIYLGCTASTSSSCTTQVPRIINPTKTQTAGTADTWRLSIQTEDSGDIVLDSAIVRIGTIESVQVQATVDPTLTFTIAGLANGTDIVTNNSACTSNTDDTNTGIAATATLVNLGVVGTSINIAGQDLTVSTNGQNGYSLTATSSGDLRDFSTGYAIATDNTLPGTFMTAGTEFFGIHACGTDVSTSDWGSATTGGGANARYAWPTQTSSLTLASRSTIASSIKTTVEYSITASGTTPAGIYQGVVTYVATATF